MHKFFYPKSVALVGASANPNRIGHRIVRNLLYGFKGEIYPINPSYDGIENLKCYSSLRELHQAAELVVILLGAEMAPQILEECAEVGSSRVMIMGAGFAEVGDEGRVLQDCCLEIARKNNIRLWGPNCMGILDVPEKHFFTFMSPLTYQKGLIPGGISLVVQSGMLLDAFIGDLMRQRVMGIAKIASIGNKADVDECDLLEYLLNDPQTRVVVLYLESIARGQRLVELLRVAEKPVVILKGGQSQAGAKAALCHTSSLAGDSRLVISVLQGVGVTIAHDFYEMIKLFK